MKKLIPVLFIFILFSNISAQKKVSDREREGFIGQIKSVKLDYLYLPEPETPDTAQKCLFCSESYYERDGNLSHTVFSGLNYKTTKNIIDEFVTSKTTLIVENPKYEGFFSASMPAEKTIEEPETLFPPDKRYDRKYVYEYDLSGRIKTERQFQNIGQLFTKLTYAYDTNGKIIGEIYESRTDKNVITYQFNDKGTLIEKNENSQSRTVAGKQSYTKTVYSAYKFDAQGNWIQRKEVATYNAFERPFVTESISVRSIVYY